jgi:AraC-like DNA-binding protein
VRLDLRFQHANSRLAFMAWRDQVHGVFNGLETLSQADAQPFSAHMVVDQAPGLRLGDIKAAPQIVVRSASAKPHQTADELGLLIQFEGSAQVDHAQAQVQLKQGDAMVLDNARAYRLSMPQRFRQGVLLMPRQAWGSRLNDVALQAGHLVPPTASGRLLVAFARSLMQESSGLSDAGLSGAALPLMDLVCAACVPIIGSQASESKSVAALRRRVRQSMHDQLTLPELCPALIAQQHGISVRYLHRIFQVQGQTFMAQVTQLRMGLCERLCNRLLRGAAEKSIQTRALSIACGYADDSTFRRAFKAHFGCAVGQWLARSAAPSLGKPNERLKR